MTVRLSPWLLILINTWYDELIIYYYAYTLDKFDEVRFGTRAKIEAKKTIAS